MEDSASPATGRVEKAALEEGQDAYFETPAAPKPGLLKRIWMKVDLDLTTVLMMLK